MKRIVKYYHHQELLSFSKIVTLDGPIVSSGYWNLQSFVDV